MQRVDHGSREAARAVRALRRKFAGDAEYSESRKRRQPRISLYRKRGANKGCAGAAHRGNQSHQWVAVRNCDAAPTVGDRIDVSGERYNGRMRLGKARRRFAICLIAGEGRKLRVIEAHH